MMRGTKKKYFASFIVLFLIVGLLVCARLTTKTIPDDETPLSGEQISASFYVYNPSWRNIWTYFCDYVGDGLISERVSVDNDADYVNSLIISAPDYTNLYPGYYIEWRAIYLTRNQTYVLGFFCDPPVVQEQADDVTEEVTEVTPDEADLIVNDVIDMIEEQNPDELITEDKSNVVEEPKQIQLSSSEILSASDSNYNINDTLIWSGYTHHSKKDTYDGIVPVEKLDDPVYLSMALPSESQSDYMKSIDRNNGHIIGDTSSPETVQVLGIGALYQTSDTTLPDTFSVYLGKMKTYAYSLSQQQWILINSVPHPSGAYIYTLPWTTTKATRCNNVESTNDYLKINLSSSEFSGNVLHFWSSCVPINKNDYLYYACAYDFWVDEQVQGKITATNGIDCKDAKGQKTIIQLYSSRGMAGETYPKTLWGHNVPISEYDNLNTSILNSMY